MHLTRHSDYALRLLIYLGQESGRRVRIADVARAQAISQAHLMKISNRLVHAGFVKAMRGRSGGIALARRPEDISLRSVIRVTEPQCTLVDCAGCQLLRGCVLPGILDEAARAFAAVLDRYTLGDLLRGKGAQGQGSAAIASHATGLCQ